MLAVDDTATFVSNDKYIVLGRELAENNGLSFDTLTTDTGYCLKQIDHTFYFYGNTKYGTINGVYGFLKTYFGLDVYYYDEYDIQTLESLSVCDLDVTVNPDIDYLFVGYGEMSTTTAGGPLTEEAVMYKFRMGFETSYYVSSGGIHNFTSIISEEKYGEAHPDWFVTVSTAYQSATTLNLSYNDYEMADALFEEIKERLIADPDIKIYGFSAPDIDAWPETDTSIALYKKYGTHSAEYILFMNRVAEKLQDWFKENAPERTLEFYLLAYNQTLTAPAKYNSTTGRYEPIDDEVKLYAGNNVKVTCYFAPSAANSYRPFTAEDEINGQYAKELQKWAALTDTVYLWLYSLYADNYLLPVDTITAMQETYRFAVENNVKILFNQSQWDQDVSTDWARLKIYLQSNLAKDCNADVNALIQKFMNDYFADASNAMLKLLSAERSWYSVLYERLAEVDSAENAQVGYLFSSGWLNWSALWDDDVVWSGTSTSGADESMLLTWYSYVEEAYAAIEKYKTSDPTLYTELYERIQLEAIPVRYLLAWQFDNTTYGTMEDIYNDCVALGMTRFGESHSFENKEEALGWMESGSFL